MTIETLEPHLLASLQAAAREILETMAETTPDAIEEVPETTSTFRDEVVGLLPFTGTRSGTFVVRCTEAMAMTIAGRLLRLGPGEQCSLEEAADGFGEVVNMLGGSFKNAWVAGGARMDLSVPSVVHRGEVMVDSDGPGSQRSCIRITCEGSTFDVGIHFEAGN